MEKTKCRKCGGTGNYFQKLYDTAIGNPKVKRNKKGRLGIWTKCPACR